MTYVVDKNEVYLYGKRLPIRGTVQQVLVSVFPQKVVLGDYTKDTKQLTSSWNADDWTGGLGKAKLDPTTDTDRFDFGTLNNRHKKQLTLQDEVVDAGNVANKNDLVTGCEFASKQYLVFDDTVVYWDEAGGALSASVRALAHAGTDATTFRLSSGASAGQTWMFIASGDEVDHYTGTVWGRTTSAGNFKYLCVWDDKLYAIGTNGRLRYTTDGTTWVDDAWLYLPVGSATGLLEFYTVAGEPTLHVATKQGMYAYDATAGVLRSTKFRVPKYPHNGLGAKEWRGTLYFPAGLDVYAYAITTLAQVGPSKDYGLPAAYKGNLIAVAPSLSWLFAGLDVQSAALPTKTAIYGTDPLAMGEILTTSVGQGLVLYYNGRGWGVLYEQAEQGKGIKWMGTSTADDKYRLWFGSNAHAYYVEMSQAIRNPLYNPSQRFQASGYLNTGRFDANWAELQKLALSLRLGITSASSTEKVRLYYSIDGNPIWTQVAEYTSAGVKEFIFPSAIAGRQGVTFYDIRFRVEMERGSDATKTPVVEFLALEYLKTQDAQWGYSFTIDGTKPYKGMTPQEINAFVKSLPDIKEKGEFAFRGPADEVTTTYVKVTREAGFEFTAEDRGYHQISVVEL